MSLDSTKHATEAGMADEGGPTTPRWVKWGGAILGAFILLAVVLALSGQEHGPGRHFGADAVPAEEGPP